MRIFSFVLHHIKPYYKYLIGLVFTCIMSTLDTSLKPLLIKYLIDIISNSLSYNIWIIFSLYAILQLFLVVIAWPLEDYCTTRYTTLLSVDIIKYYINKLYEYPYSFFQNHLSGDIISKISDAFNYIPELIGDSIEDIGKFIFLMILTTSLLGQIHLIFALLTLIWLALFIFTTYYYAPLLLSLSKETSRHRTQGFGSVNDYITNMLSVKTFVTKDFEIARFLTFQKKFVDASYKHAFYQACYYIILGLIATLYILMLMFFLIKGYKEGWVTAGNFAFVILTNYGITSKSYKLSHNLRKFISRLGKVEHALSLLESYNVTPDLAHASALKISYGEIIFDQVGFKYNNLENLFTNKSVIITSGQKVGLVGYSGGGKSTFVNLILRLHEVTSGRILIDNQNISTVTQDSLRDNITLIPQDPLLFHRSLRENIRYGKISASDDEVIAAAKKAFAHDFIISLPAGYDSLVGERGVKLSGGQRQRIAIARAILKNSPILILDEATSQLDSITENYIQNSLIELMHHKTTIVIAHRLSTLLKMDRILVFDQGKIIQDGSHIDLLNQEGLYKNLWNTQIGGWLPDKK